MAPSKGLLYTDREHTRVAGFSNVDWPGSPLTGDLSQTFAFFLEKILCHEKVRNRVSCHNLVSQSIVR